MYRCRRLIVIVLSLAVVASTFILVASADESEFTRGFFYVDSLMVFLDNGNGASFQIPAGETRTVTIPSIKLSSNTLSANQSLAINFKIRVYVYFQSDHDMSPTNLIPRNYNGYASTTGSMSLIQFRDGTYPRFIPDQLNLDQYGYMCSFLLTNTNSINLNLTCDWYNASQYKMTLWYRIEELSIDSSFNYFASTIFVPAMNGITNLLTFQNTKLFSDSFSYNEISYDSDGNSTITERSGNWITAILGTLKSILAPVEKQVEEEQLAKDAGFNDVLGDAYSSSSPGSLIDILDIGDLASWDETSWEDSMGDSFLYWFSQSCADDIDTVPRTRGEEPQIIDFYSQHINDYWEALGIGTADQGGN